MQNAVRIVLKDLSLFVRFVPLNTHVLCEPILEQPQCILGAEETRNILIINMFI